MTKDKGQMTIDNSAPFAPSSVPVLLVPSVPYVLSFVYQGAFP